MPSNPEYTGKKIICSVAVFTVATQLGEMGKTQDGPREEQIEQTAAEEEFRLSEVRATEAQPSQRFIHSAPPLSPPNTSS